MPTGDQPTPTGASERGAGPARIVIGVGITAALAAAATVALGLVLALALPDESLIGRAGAEVSVLTEAFRHVVQMLLVDVYDAPLPGDPSRVAPAVLAAVPTAACAVSVAWEARHARRRPAWERLVLGAAIGLPFALLILLCARAAGTDEEFIPSTGSVFLAALVWGSLGGVVGALLALRRDGIAPPGAGVRPPEVATDVLLRSLRPLAVLLAVAALAGATAWIVRAAIDPGSSSDDRSPGLAMVEDALYAVEHGVHLAELGAFVLFEPPVVELEILGVPFPPDASEDLASSLERYRVFAYGQALPSSLYVALLVLTVGLTASLAFYAGFSVARGRGTRGPLQGAAWGALVGPIWAIALQALDALIDKPVFGRSADWSVLICLGLLATPLGAVGGMLATRLRTSWGRPSRSSRRRPGDRRREAAQPEEPAPT